MPHDSHRRIAGADAEERAPRCNAVDGCNRVRLHRREAGAAHRHTGAEPDALRAFGGERDDTGGTIRRTDDGGYIVAGDTESFDEADRDAWMFKLDAAGHMEWQKTYGDQGDDLTFYVRQADDGMAWGSPIWVRG